MLFVSHVSSLSRYVIRPVLPSEIIQHPAKFPHRPGFLGGLRTRLFTKFDHISEFPQALQKEVPAAVSAARAQRLFTCNLCVAAPTAMGADLPAHGQHAGYAVCFSIPVGCFPCRQRCARCAIASLSPDRVVSHHLFVFVCVFVCVLPEQSVRGPSCAYRRSHTARRHRLHRVH